MGLWLLSQPAIFYLKIRSLSSQGDLFMLLLPLLRPLQWTNPLLRLSFNGLLQNSLDFFSSIFPLLSYPHFWRRSAMLPGFPQLSLAPQTCPSLPRAVSTSQCLLMSSQCSSLLDSSSLETCYLLWSLVVFSGVLLSFLEPRLLPWSCCLLWSLIIFSGASLPSLESHLLSWSVPLPELLCVCCSPSSSEFLVIRIYVFQHMFALVLHL